MKERYKAVFLDWNGTLSKSEFFDHLSEGDQNVELHDKLSQSLTNIWGTISKQWMKGELSSEDVAQAVSLVSGIPYETVLHEIADGSSNLKIDEEVLNLVHQIRELGIKVVIATGNVDAFDRWTVPSLHLDQKFDHILNSSNLGIRKKDKDETGKSLFFKPFLDENKIEPGESILIDNSPDKDDAVKNAGVVYLQLEEGISLAETLKDLLAELRQDGI